MRVRTRSCTSPRPSAVSTSPRLARSDSGTSSRSRGVPAVEDPSLHGRLRPLGPGKDSSTGHGSSWASVATRLRRPFRTASRRRSSAWWAEVFGAPLDLQPRLRRRCRDRRLRRRTPHSGRPILYTSQDSVLQLAAHTRVFDEQMLHAACARLRASLSGPDAVRRVIARPFEGEPGAFERTLGRRDYTLPPPSPSHLSLLAQAGVEVHGVGKVTALFERDSFSAEHRGRDQRGGDRERRATGRRARRGLRFRESDRDRPALWSSP